MWPLFTLNRPMVWLGLLGVAALPWASGVGVRLTTLLLLALGLWDAWRVVRQEHARRALGEQVMLSSEDGIMICDARHRILTVNPAFTQITGYALEEVRGQDPSMLSAGRHDKAFYDRYWEALTSLGKWEGEIWNQRKQGDQYPEWLRIQAYRGENGKVSHYVGLFTDISRHKAREQDMRRIGFEDPLTGLPNRRRLHDLLSSRLRHLRAGEGLDMALIDIDGFKAINDAMGVEAGDRLLSRFGQRLARQVAGGVVGRLGGDEFMVIRTTNFDDHDTWVAGLCEHLTAPFEQDGQSLRLGLTVGSCRAPDDGRDSNVLLQRLESALYSAKRHGRNHHKRFQPALDEPGDRQLELVNDLRAALAHGDQLELHYQTQHSLKDGSLVGMEALMRWRHPRLGMVSPGDFIPLAERHGLMTPLGAWVIEQAVSQLARWQQAGLPRVPVWVNISALQLIQGDLESRISACLARYKVPPQLLGLELTESVLLDERAGDVYPRMTSLRDKGHQIAIDDFGTGYSSLSYLKRLPVDKLKLDRAFVRALPDDRADAAIVGAVLAMAKGLSLTVVAEGVETPAQRDFLRKQGCPEVQGFLFSRPVPSGEIDARLRQEGTGVYSGDGAAIAPA
ncbi:MAG: EAL domain-containing protein [Onishia taeanensis]|uniref:putative bifunctional diguanylate cyclase/phosphodiesterase n=1 Tax=Onishia taeanensis TaxID=284577 RepID=UPI003C7A3853